MYALAASFGDGVIAYQMLALGCVISTALIIYKMARRFADRLTATIAALIYILMLNLFEGHGGQSPVFYNLFMTAAASLLMSVFCDRQTIPIPHLVRTGFIIMILCGISLQIKYSAIGECLFFGLILTFIIIKIMNIYISTFLAFLFVVAAIIPTLLFFSFYNYLKQSDIFIFSNFSSILMRRDSPIQWVMERLIKTVLILATPILVGIAGAFGATSNEQWSAQKTFVLLWNGAAWFSYLAFGSYYEHYALPLIAPTALLSCLASGKWIIFRTSATCVGLLTSFFVLSENIRDSANPQMIRRLAAAIKNPENCPYIYEGPPALYHVANLCLPTRLAFPDHINRAREAHAIGVNPITELNRILQKNPSYIVATFPFALDHNKEADALIQRKLATSYIPVATEVERKWGVDYHIIVFKLRGTQKAHPNAYIPTGQRAGSQSYFVPRRAVPSFVE